MVATPERIESILRNPEYSGWYESFGAVCADEAHLLSSLYRGPTFRIRADDFPTAKSAAPPRAAFRYGG